MMHARFNRFAAVVLIAVMGLAGCAATPSDTSDAPALSLFDGKTLDHWEVTNFGGEGDVHIEDGAIILPFGSSLTGITWDGDPPAKMNYEISLEAKRIDGYDFFCGLTFPVGDRSCSLICGGWGGGTTGLSSLDGDDASQNETSTWVNYESNQWYKIRVRVEPKRIQAWLDDECIVDANITDRRVSIRPEVDLSRPLGVASYETTAAIRNMKWKNLKK